MCRNSIFPPFSQGTLMRDVTMVGNVWKALDYSIHVNVWLAGRVDFARKKLMNVSQPHVRMAACV